MAEHKVWVNNDLMGALWHADRIGGNETARALRERLVERCWPGAQKRGFWFAGWTLIDLSENEAGLLKCLRPSCFMPADA